MQPRPIHRYALTVAAGLLAAVSLSAMSEGLTRAEVQAQLAEARASGQLDRAGEAGATEAVIAARDRANETERLVALARNELAVAEAAAEEHPRLASYVEAGPDGPQVVLMTFEPDGTLVRTETLALAAID